MFDAHEIEESYKFAKAVAEDIPALYADEGCDSWWSTVSVFPTVWKGHKIGEPQHLNILTTDLTKFCSSHSGDFGILRLFGAIGYDDYKLNKEGFISLAKDCLDKHQSIALEHGFTHSVTQRQTRMWKRFATPIENIIKETE